MPKQQYRGVPIGTLRCEHCADAPGDGCGDDCGFEWPAYIPPLGMDGVWPECGCCGEGAQLITT